MSKFDQTDFNIDTSSVAYETDANKLKSDIFSQIQVNTQAVNGSKPSMKNFTHTGSLDAGDFSLQNMTDVLTNSGPGHYDDNYINRRFDFIANLEGGYEPSMHYVNGVKHIGYGVNLEVHKDLVQQKLRFNDTDMKDLMDGKKAISKNQARLISESLIQDADKMLVERFGQVPLNADQRIALTSMAYNAPALIGPNITKAILNGDMASISDEILNKSNANKLKGLDYRRKMEHDMFFSGDENMMAKKVGDTYNDLEQGGDNIFLKALNVVKDAVISPVAAAEHQPATNGAIINNNPEPNYLISKAAVNLADQGKYEAQDQTTWYQDFANSLLEVLPKSAQTFIRYKGEELGLTGSDAKTEVIDGNKYFSEESLQALGALIKWAESKGKKSIQYQDYDEFFGINKNGLFLSEIVGSKDGIEWVTKNVPAEERGISYSVTKTKVWDGKKYVLKDVPYHIALQEDAFAPKSIAVNAAGYIENIFGSNRIDKYSSYANLAFASQDSQALTLGLVLGRFNWKRNDKGELIITDTYNFTGHKADTGNYDKLRSKQDTRGKADPFKFVINLGVLL